MPNCPRWEPHLRKRTFAIRPTQLRSLNRIKWLTGRLLCGCIRQYNAGASPGPARTVPSTLLRIVSVARRTATAFAVPGTTYDCPVPGTTYDCPVPGTWYLVRFRKNNWNKYRNCTATVLCTGSTGEFWVPVTLYSFHYQVPGATTRYHLKYQVL